MSIIIPANSLNKVLARTAKPHQISVKKGGFVLAVDAGVPIVPIVIRGTRDMAPKGRFVIHRVPVSMEILDPVETAGHTRKTKDALLEQVRGLLQTRLDAGARKDADAPC
ncbi:hypothetical protein LJC22_04060 [Desulfosarcina sp. OttesenSCG-928-G10]|nr:hypothetical protein [Desulfosarcina sp. OttesenSCG-928-G10]